MEIMSEGDPSAKRYRVVNSSFSELIRKSEHWDRLFPEALEWRREQHQRAVVEASNEMELLEMRMDNALEEDRLFPERMHRALADSRVDIIDRYESRYSLRCGYMFGLINPATLKIKDGHVNGIDWVKTFETK